MHDQIEKRLAELQQAAKDRQIELIVIHNLIAELRSLLTPPDNVTP